MDLRVSIMQPEQLLIFDTYFVFITVAWVGYALYVVPIVIVLANVRKKAHVNVVEVTSTSVMSTSYDVEK